MIIIDLSFVALNGFLHSISSSLDILPVEIRSVGCLRRSKFNQAVLFCMNCILIHYMPVVFYKKELLTYCQTTRKYITTMSCVSQQVKRILKRDLFNCMIMTTK